MIELKLDEVMFVFNKMKEGLSETEIQQIAGFRLNNTKLVRITNYIFGAHGDELSRDSYEERKKLRKRSLLQNGFVGNQENSNQDLLDPSEQVKPSVHLKPKDRMNIKKEQEERYIRNYIFYLVCNRLGIKTKGIAELLNSSIDSIYYGKNKIDKLIDHEEEEELVNKIFPDVQRKIYILYLIYSRNGMSLNDIAEQIQFNDFSVLSNLVEWGKNNIDQDEAEREANRIIVALSLSKLGLDNETIHIILKNLYDFNFERLLNRLNTYSEANNIDNKDVLEIINRICDYLKEGKSFEEIGTQLTEDGEQSFAEFLKKELNGVNIQETIQEYNKIQEYKKMLENIRKAEIKERDEAESEEKKFRKKGSKDLQQEEDLQNYIVYLACIKYLNHREKEKFEGNKEQKDDLENLIKEIVQTFSSDTERRAVKILERLMNIGNKANNATQQAYLNLLARLRSILEEEAGKICNNILNHKTSNEELLDNKGIAKSKIATAKAAARKIAQDFLMKKKLLEEDYDNFGFKLSYKNNKQSRESTVKKDSRKEIDVDNLKAELIRLQRLAMYRIIEERGKRAKEPFSNDGATNKAQDIPFNQIYERRKQIIKDQTAKYVKHTYYANNGGEEDIFKDFIDVVEKLRDCGVTIDTATINTIIEIYRTQSEIKSRIDIKAIKYLILCAFKEKGLRGVNSLCNSLGEVLQGTELYSSLKKFEQNSKRLEEKTGKKSLSELERLLDLG